MLPQAAFAISTAVLLATANSQTTRHLHPAPSELQNHSQFHLIEPFVSYHGLNNLETAAPFLFLSNMTSIHEQTNGWHPGELAMHKLLRVPTSMRGNPTSLGFPASHAYRVATSPLVAFGALDEQGRPWTTVWGGERGFARPIAQGVLGAQSIVDRKHDPVVQALVGKVPAGEMVKPDEQTGPTLMAGLSIDLETRDRVKLAGRMIVGAVMPREGAEGTDDGNIGEAQVAMAVMESLGNCPKYLNKKDIRPHIPSPKLVSDSFPLPREAVDLIDNSDLFFLSSTNGESMDTNHRGGPQGFVRILSNTAEEVTIVYPEYSGNRLYQTLGNLHTNPKVGLAIPDFDTSDILYLTGTTDLLVGPAASAILPHCKLAVKIRVHAARLVQDGTPFRGDRGEPSPYNPPVRRLASECPAGSAQAAASSAAIATARLVGREEITPTIARFTFELEPTERGRQSGAVKAWRAGQHATFDFSDELDQGWSHMREDDPSSLNDDFIRTFTVSSLPPDGDGALESGTKLEITARKNGPATRLLWRQNLRVPLDLPVLGFGGEESFRMPTSGGGEQRPIFVAGGVGITPLLAQAPGVLGADPEAAGEGASGLHLLWSLQGADLPLALDAFKRIPGLAARTHLFVTGKRTPDEALTAKLRELGAVVASGRMTQDVLLAPSNEAPGKAKFYVCTGPELHKVLLPWLVGQEVVSENFNY